LSLFWHFARAAASRTFCTAGSSSPIRIAMMAITTNNSMSVKPRLLKVDLRIIPVPNWLRQMAARMIVFSTTEEV
jgi:hypothetical protein